MNDMNDVQCTYQRGSFNYTFRRHSEWAKLFLSWPTAALPHVHKLGLKKKLRLYEKALLSPLGVQMVTGFSARLPLRT